ncbi:MULTISPECIES: protein TolR [Thalassobaculum]|uniref:Cell division and transport-associated protein TolR (TC 2.C.1.2.1) n=1 Tax=Thalassobaculum litoreum DSM 18839 TaxID=1123362 RepID=A0A8G2BGC3_9PROT|nr:MULTISPECIES: protein TolR [Thalassobaculum]SDF24233.1 Cell division and transport-associated protein TolR (TC 2.C.1.2.1) [Thalassobaculum litoreum DSM 18839]
MAGGLIKRGTGHGSRRRRNPPLSEINVTPFVDVMLVLLIVFMVTAPLLTVGVPVDLPKTKAAQLTDEVEPLVVTVRADGSLYLQETAISRDELVPKLMAVSGANPDLRIFVRGDKSIAYGSVMEVMGQISSAGFSRVALLAELPEESAGAN